MAQKNVDLVKMFGQIASTLASNQTQLNKADTYNHDHGDHMVDIFNMITQAMAQSPNANAGAQLANAAKALQDSQSGSAQLYSAGLSQAAKEFKSQNVTADNALQLVQALLGGGQAAAAPQASSPLGSLLSGLMGAQGSEGDAEIDAGDILNAGMAFLSAKQRGQSNVNALIEALVSDSAMSDSTHRTQSSQIVLNTLMDFLGKMNK
jgi:hypothetical protein